jgi:uncharacterized protein
MLRNGYGGTIDRKGAQIRFGQACQGAVAEACHDLGLLLLSERPNKDDYSATRMHFSKACDLALAQGCYNLAVMLATGIGGSSNLLKAQELFSRACNMGYSDGCDYLASSAKDRNKTEEIHSNWAL